MSGNLFSFFSSAFVHTFRAFSRSPALFLLKYIDTVVLVLRSLAYGWNFGSKQFEDKMVAVRRPSRVVTVDIPLSNGSTGLKDINIKRLKS